MGYKVLEIINKKTNTERGYSDLTLLDTEFEGATLEIGTDDNFPEPPNISNLDYLESGTVLSEQMLDNVREVQVNLKESDTLNIDNVITWTNTEVDRAGTRINKSYFDFINDIGASWYGILNPALHAVGQPASYEVLKQCAENVKSLLGFKIEHQNYISDIQSQLKEWSKTQPYESTIDYFTITLNYTSIPAQTYVDNPLGYTVTVNGSLVTISGIGVTPDDGTGAVIITSVTGSGTGTATINITSTVIESDRAFNVVCEEVIVSSGGNFQNNITPLFYYLGNSATHFDITTPTLEWLQGRYYI